MPAEVRRVALLARPGVASDRLRVLLDEAGVQCVLNADPTSLDVADLVDASPNVLLIALDAVTEDALDRFGGVLGDPSVDVIFEEAELVAQRDGWDAARWQRHLVAKLQRHDSVLPPLPAGEDEAPESIALPDDDSESLADIAEAFAHTPDEAVEEAVAEAVAEASGHPIAEDVLDQPEGSDALAPLALADDIAGAGLGARAAGAEAHPFDPANADYDFDAGDLDQSVSAFGLDARPVDSDASAADNPFDPLHAETLAWDGPASPEPVTFEAPAGDAATFDPAAFDASAFDPAAFDATTFDAATFEPPASLDFDPTQFTAREEVADSTFDVAFDAPRAEAAAELAPALEAPGARGYELTLDDGTGALVPEPPSATNRFRHDLDDLQARISTLELVDDTPKRGPEQARGAVLVLAGIGGPDAVRQLLGALPTTFPRPVVVQQRLDGGRYDKLVAQMQRATTLQVKLAEAGQPALAGFVYILPDTVGLELRGESLRFGDDPAQVLAALPASDSAVLMFSGSDATLVDAAMNHSWGGAFVAGQTPDGCYDATAPGALVARGAEAGQPAELAHRLAERWTH